MGKIFWFSATGNSFRAAQQIAEESGGKYELVKITDSLIASSPVIEDKEVGLVFPVYGWTLPQPVKDFIKKAEFRNIEYCFGVITMGGAAGKAGLILKSLLKKRGIELSFFDRAAMPDNCIYLFDTTSSKGEKHVSDFIEKGRDSLSKTAEKIGGKERQPGPGGNLFGYFLTYIVGSLFSLQYRGFDKKFSVSNACTGCGICRDVCSVSNITIVEGRPVFLDKCVICMGCINWCPVKAIDYKGKTAKRSQYHYPGLDYKDIMG